MSLGRRMSRRRLLAGAAALAAAGGTGATLMALRGAESPAAAPDAPSTRPPASATAPPTPTATPEPPRGGIARIAARGSFNFDTFDGQRSGEASVIEVLGRTHSRLVQWSDFDAPQLGPDLAARWEQPDSATAILHLDPAARWHDREPLNGRPVTADDVVTHFTRTLQFARGKAPLAQRLTDYANFRRPTSTANTVVFRTNGPDPFLLSTLAGRFALIQPPEAVGGLGDKWHELQVSDVVGSGPWLYDANREGALHFAANRSGHRQPRLDGLQIFAPFDVSGRLAVKQLDEGVTTDRRHAVTLRALAGGPGERPVFEETPVISTLSIDGAPWNDANLLRALSGALNRAELSRRLFGGRAAPSGPVSPLFPGFALSESELMAFPGYGADAAFEAREARARWDAAGGPALGSVTIDFPSIFDPLYSASAVVTGMLNDVLGDQFRPAVETYTAIATKAAAGLYGNGNAALWFGWGPPVAEPDPFRSLIETYGPHPLPGAEGAALTGALVRLAVATDLDERKAIARAVSRQILEAGGAGTITWLHQLSEQFRWPYLSPAAATPFWSQHLDFSRYIDPGHAAHGNRPPVLPTGR